MSGIFPADPNTILPDAPERLGPDITGGEIIAAAATAESIEIDRLNLFKREREAAWAKAVETARSLGFDPDKGSYLDRLDEERGEQSMFGASGQASAAAVARDPERRQVLAARAAHPEAFADVPVLDADIEKYVTEKLKAEHADATETLALAPGGAGTFALDMVGRMGASVADTPNIALTMATGGIGGGWSLARQMLFEGTLSIAGEALTLPSQREQAERLDLPAPNTSAQLALAGVVGAAVPVAFRGAGYTLSGVEATSRQLVDLMRSRASQLTDAERGALNVLERRNADERIGPQPAGQANADRVDEAAAAMDEGQVPPDTAPNPDADVTQAERLTTPPRAEPPRFADGVDASAALIRQHEGYRSAPYWDVNAWRVGYGSDTITLDDGRVVRVTPDMRIDGDIAERDLARRVVEFQQSAIADVGADRWASWSPEQQAAVTSITYNYGDLDRTGIVDVLRTGSDAEVAAAIASLGAHNGGINASRRMHEAGVFLGRAEIGEAAPAGVGRPVRIGISGLGVDPRAYQFRSDVNAEGVGTGLDRVNEWDELLAGQFIVHERADGSRYIADGHHRLSLAKRLEAQGHPPIEGEAFILREADGYTVEQVRAIAAIKNIENGSATAIDAAKVLRVDPERLEKLTLRNAQARDARGLMQLSDEAFDMVTNRLVPEPYAAHVGQLTRDPALQEGILRALIQANPSNMAAARQVASDAQRAGLAARSADAQSSLFGDDFDVAETLFKERAQVMSRALAQIRKDRQVFRTLVAERKRISETGNTLNDEINAQRLDTDDAALALIEKLAGRAGPIDDALNDAARVARTSGTRSAVDQFLAAVRSAIDGGGLSRLLSEPDGSGAGRAAADVPADEGAARAASERQADPELDAGGAPRPEDLAEDLGDELDGDTYLDDFLADAAEGLSRNFRQIEDVQPVRDELDWEAQAERKPPEAIFPAPAKTRAVWKEAQEADKLDIADAQARVAEWKAEAQRIGREEDHSDKVILSLFDESGSWSRPFEEAGFRVLRYDVQNTEFQDLIEFFPIADIQAIWARGLDVYGVLSACPCTTFAASGSRWWAPRHDVPDEDMVAQMFGDRMARYFDTPLEVNKTLAHVTEAIVEMANPSKFHVLENPIGRIEKMTGLPKPLLRFDPADFGDPYTKRTSLYGDFNADLPMAPVEAVEGSKMQSKLRGDNPEHKRLRSMTPEGFAYAFFMANKPEPRVRSAQPEAAAPTRVGADPAPVELGELVSGRIGSDWRPYIDSPEGAELVPMDRLSPVRRRADGVRSAVDLMERAAAGDADRRGPIALRDEGDGTYTIRDGNSTFAVAEAAGWSEIPGRVLTDEEYATETARQNAAGIFDAAAEGAPRRTVLVADLPKPEVKELETRLKARQPFEDVDGLLRVAEVNHASLNSAAAEIADELGVEFSPAPVKARDSALRKINDKYAGNARKLADAARTGFTARTIDEAEAFVAELGKRFHLIDEGWNVTPAGYFDRKLMVVFDDGALGEVQIWPPGMLDAKEARGGHKLYEDWRDPSRPEAEREKALADMLALYGEVRDALDPSFAEKLGFEAPAGRSSAASASDSSTARSSRSTAKAVSREGGDQVLSSRSTEPRPSSDTAASSARSNRNIFMGNLSNADIAPAGAGRNSEATPEGDQYLVDGVAPVTTRDRLAVAAARPMQGGAAPAGGLFDDATRNQMDMFDSPAGTSTADLFGDTGSGDRGAAMQADSGMNEIRAALARGEDFEVPTGDVVNGEPVLVRASELVAEMDADEDFLGALEVCKG